MYSYFGLFEEFGKYDHVVVLTLINGSETFKKYGSHITGQFYYTKDERKKLLDGKMTDSSFQKITCVILPEKRAAC